MCPTIRFSGVIALVAAAVSLCVALLAAEPPARKSYPNWVRPRIIGGASDAGDFALDEKNLRAMFPEFVWTADQLKYLDEHLRLGDSRAAIVASVKPLVVSAYSDELDGVILIRFPDELAQKYSLDVGSRLIGSWVYPNLSKPPRDVVRGKYNLRRYNNGEPLVADFFGGPPEKIANARPACRPASGCVSWC